MSKWDKIDKKQITEIKFESIDIIETSTYIPPKASYRVSRKDAADIPRTDEEAKRELRIMLTTLFALNLNQNYAQLESRCDIKPDTFQKIIRKRNPKGISRTMLAKFVVGAKVDIKTADTLFLYLGHGLDDRNRFDYILMCALRDKDDIEIFNDDLMKYGYPSIFSSPD